MTWPAAAVFRSLRSLAWKGVKNWVQRSFASVPAISTADLADWLQKETLSPLLIDARSAAEYSVSHLPGAHQAKTLAEAEAVIKEAGICKQTAKQTAEQMAKQTAGQMAEQAPIVLYCSIGYRSGRLGKALQAAGYRVTNLEGSIFQWANEGRSLVTDPPATDPPATDPSERSSAHHSTPRVHPYSWLWGLLLDPAVMKSD